MTVKGPHEAPPSILVDRRDSPSPPGSALRHSIRAYWTPIVARRHPETTTSIASQLQCCIQPLPVDYIPVRFTSQRGIEPNFSD